MPGLNEENYLDNLLNSVGESLHNDDVQNEDESLVMPELHEESVSEPIDLTEKSEISEDELQKLADLDLDNLLSDISENSVDVETLFSGDNAVQDKNFDLSESDIKAEGKDEHNSDTEPDVLDFDVNNNDSLDNINSGDTDNTGEDNVRADNDGDGDENRILEDNSHKKNKKNKNKKEKKGLLKAIKSVFFEKLDENDTPISEEMIKEVSKSDDEEILPDFNRIEQEDHELDENEQLLREMYGENSNQKETEIAPPEKGIFAKIKYRIEQFRKKSQEEDILEQEAEDKEFEEYQKAKQEKKEVLRQKKEEAKEKKVQKKEQKPKKEKPVRTKKEKKPKPAPKPGDILKIKPRSVICFVLFVSGVVILILMLNKTINYNNSSNAAKACIESGNYSKAYDMLAGMKLNENDKNLYDQTVHIMYVERQYESYQNYKNMNMSTEAINALIKGIERYNTYAAKGEELGVKKYMDECRDRIYKSLEEDYKITKAKADELVRMYDTQFVQYYKTIEEYGKVKQ